MGKNNINSNFENLKAEMMKKKEVAKDTKINENVNVNNCEIENKTVNNDVNICEVSLNEVTTDVDEIVNPGISQNKIVIKKTKKINPPKRITYYLNQDTISKIEKYSKLTGMGKSELVQTLLDVSLNNLEIK